jgi:hypothetical protein
MSEGIRLVTSIHPPPSRVSPASAGAAHAQHASRALRSPCSACAGNTSGRVMTWSTARARPRSAPPPRCVAETTVPAHSGPAPALRCASAGDGLRRFCALRHSSLAAMFRRAEPSVVKDGALRRRAAAAFGCP